MKKNLVIISIIMSLILLPLLAHADTVTIDSKANILNKLTILQGDGVNFNLPGQLKRSEAIAFIIRILGKEAFVKNNSTKYQVTTFKDVKAADWFASYVGFSAEQGLVKGFPDGGYHPNEFVTEKAFLNLVLGALGYSVGKDFVWDTIYQSALNLGLVTDAKYKDQTADNANYTRADVVNVLHNSLTVPIKNTKKTIVDILIAEKIVDRALAVTLGLAKEITLTSIQTASVTNETTLNIDFNQKGATLAQRDISIYETNNKANVLISAIKSQVDKNLVIQTALQKPNISYTIEISMMNEELGKAAIISSTFTGYKSPEVKSNLFKINKVVPVSKNVINVYFTQPVNSNAALPIFYELFKNNSSYVKGSFTNMSVKALSKEKNVVSIYLKNNTIADDGVYSLKLSGDIMSAYGVMLNDGLGDSSAAFVNNSLDLEGFNVSSVYPIDAKVIRVEFNREIDTTSAMQLGNYQLSTALGTPLAVYKTTIPADANGSGVLLWLTGNLDKTINYQLTVKNVNDIYSITSLSETKFPFITQSIAARQDLKVINVTALDTSTIKVYFDRNVDPTSAVNTSYYIIEGTSDTSFLATPTSVYYNRDEPYAVKLYMPSGKSVVSSNSYKLKVINMLQDEFGNSSIKDADRTFNGSSDSNVKPLIFEATIIGKDTIKIKSQKELSASGTNIIGSNFTVEAKDGNNTLVIKTPTNISIIDGSTMILRFDALDSTKNYTLKFNTLTDYSGVNVRGVSDGLTSIAVSKGN